MNHLSLLFLCIIATLANATEVMHRPAIYDQNATTFMQPGSPEIQTRHLQTRASGKVSMGYFVNWGIYARNFQVSNVVPSTLTHILYAFADCNPSSGNVILTDTYADQEKHFAGDSWSEPGVNLYGNLKQLYLLKRQNRNLKVSLSIGGWTYSQNGHFNFVTNPSARANFVSSAIILLEDNGFDGIDIDFEYPSNPDQGKGFASLITELRAALNNHASKKGDSTPYILTVATAAGPSNYAYIDFPKMDAALTFWNLMAYDYAGSWSQVSDDMSNVYGGPISGINTDAALSAYLSRGASRNKIVMGIPLYGRGFTGTNGIRQPFTGIGTGSWEAGVWDVKVLPLPGASVFEDNANIASYSYDANKKELISFDTPNIARKKVAYLNNKGLAGSMYWELSNDKTGSNSLVAHVVSALGSLESSPNHLNYPGSKFDNIRKMATTPNNPTDPGPGPGCGGVAPWSATTTYTAGMTASYASHLWTAKWWTLNEAPAVSDSSPWKDNGGC